MATLPQALRTGIPKFGVQMSPAPPAAPAPPPAPAGGEEDVLAQKAQQKLEPLQQRISELESQQMQLGAERSQFEAAQKAKQATGELGFQQAFQQRTEQAPLRGELEQKVQQEKDFFFQPSREDGMAMASLASLIMVIGTSLGRGGKGNAMAALSGLNGMMEGYQKGRDDIFKQEKSQFETNAKALTTQIGNIRKALEDYEKMAVRDRETATLRLRESMAKEGADFLAARAEREGAVRLLPELRKTERQLQQQLDKHESKAADARTKAQAAEDAAKRREEEAKQRAADREFQIRLSRSLVDSSRVAPEQKQIAKIGTAGSQANIYQRTGKIITDRRDAEAVDNSVVALREIESLRTRLKDPEIITGLLSVPQPFIQKLRSLTGRAVNEEEVVEALNDPASKLTGNDKTTLFIKDAVLAAFKIEQGLTGTRVPVFTQRLVGPILDPRAYRPETFDKLLETRSHELENRIYDKGLDENDIEMLKSPRKKPAGAPAAPAAATFSTSVTVGGKTYTKPPGMSDADWNAYKRDMGVQ